MLIILSLIDRIRKRRLTYALNQIAKSISSLNNLCICYVLIEMLQHISVNPIV